MLICDLTQFYSPVGGGVRRYLSEKAKHLGAAGHRHLLIVPGERTERREEEGNIIWTIASPLISRRARYRALTNLAMVEEILEREKPDLIESGDPYQVAWKAIASGRGLGIPVVGFYHSHFSEATIRSVAKYFGGLAVLMAQEISQRYAVSLYNRFAKTMVPNQGLADLLTGWGIENAVTLELGVATETFYPDEERGHSFRQSLKVDEDRKILLYVGRLAPEKNFRTLLAAFAELHRSYPNKYHLIVIGDGTLRSPLQRLCESTRQVTWHSYCQNATTLADFYRAADVFVHPGIHETFGLVTLESQACGTPVIGISGSMMDRIVFTGLEHWTANDDADSLSKAIATICSANLKDEALAAAEHVRTHYDWKNVFERLFAIYEEVISKD
ncbi:MAG: glycosyltransferase [Chthoniobacterales bacterium]